VVQSIFGRKGNFEVVMPWAAGGLAHFWHDNDVGLAWHGPTRFGGGRVDAVALVQSRFGPRGNLEVVTRVGNRLVHTRKPSRSC
jgi:hypothetical protein